MPPGKQLLCLVIKGGRVHAHISCVLKKQTMIAFFFFFFCTTSCENCTTQRAPCSTTVTLLVMAYASRQNSNVARFAPSYWVNVLLRFFLVRPLTCSGFGGKLLCRNCFLLWGNRVCLVISFFFFFLRSELSFYIIFLARHVAALRGSVMDGMAIFCYELNGGKLLWIISRWLSSLFLSPYLSLSLFLSVSLTLIISLPIYMSVRLTCLYFWKKDCTCQPDVSLLATSCRGLGLVELGLVASDLVELGLVALRVVEWGLVESSVSRT